MSNADKLDFMKPTAFDIGAEKVEDFRAVAKVQSARNLKFSFGKPSGLSRGVFLMTKKSRHIHLPLVIRRDSKNTSFAKPTLEFCEPELSRFLEPVHLFPVVDVTTKMHSGYLMPYRVTGWHGYENLYKAFAMLDDEKQGILLKFKRGSGSDYADYAIDVFPLEPEHQEIRKNIYWLSAEEAAEAAPSVPFAELLADDMNLSRAWNAVRQRKGGAA